MHNKKEILRLKRHRRILQRIQGSSQRPRLVIRRSLKHLHASVVDDEKNKILFSVSTFDKAVKEKFPSAGNIKAAQMLGELLALRAKEKGVTQIIFDRAGYLYHGRVRAFADALRKGGIQF